MEKPNPLDWYNQLTDEEKAEIKARENKEKEFKPVAYPLEERVRELQKRAWKGLL